MKIPELIKAGDQRVLLGVNKVPPKVDCRVWAEEQYRAIVGILREVRREDIVRFATGEGRLLSQPLRKKINEFLLANENIKIKH